MKKYFVVLAVLYTISTGALQAQALQMNKGSNLFSAGLGLVEGWGFNASFDHGLVDTWGPGLFTIGGFAGFQSWNRNIILLGKYSVNNYAFAVRCTYRYYINHSFEVYGAAMTGLKTVSYSENWGGTDKVRPFQAVIGGCRYSFAPNISVFGEVGGSLSFLNGGLSFTF